LIREYVADASVILKWVLGDEREPDQEKAMRLLDTWAAGNVTISAPILWQYEVGNFLGKEIPGEAAEKMNLLMSLGIKGIELSEKVYRQCFYWMKENKITFYDASYLAVAREIEATLVTADEKFVNRMDRFGPLCLLKELNLG